MPSEKKKVCAEAINLIISFNEQYPEIIVQNERFYQLISHLKLENLTSRRPLIKSLVLIGSSVSSGEIQQKIYLTILEPLMTKFVQLFEREVTSDSSLADYYECLSGVADAGQSEAALIIFRFLQPAVKCCAPLMNKRPHSQLLINSILEFIRTVTDVLFFYVESSEECSNFHLDLLGIIDAYRNTQLHKYRSTEFLSGDVEEQQTRDLIYLIEILCHSISKTYMPHYERTGENSAKVALTGLEMILPLMSEGMLKIPDLCSSFFRLLLFVSDLSPEILVQVSKQTLLDFLRCVNLALMNEFGVERLKSALEIVNNIASQFCVPSEKLGTTFIPGILADLLDVIFETALQNSCEMDVFDEASSALYSIICLSKEKFCTYIDRLLNLPTNSVNREHLQISFNKLIASSTFEVTRTEKRSFHKRFQEFLSETSGALCLS